MRRIIQLSTFGVVALVLSSQAAAYKLWLVQLGDGPGGATMSQPNPMALLRVRSDGTSATIVNSYAAPSTDISTLITAVPSFVTDGQLSMSQDGRYLVFPGYGKHVAESGAIAGATAAVVPRIVGRFDTLTSTFDTSTRLTDAFNTSNYRGVTTLDGSQFWLTGNGAGATPNSGVRYAELGDSSSVRVLTANYTTANPEVFNGELYYSRTTGTGTGDTTNSGVLKASNGLATTAGGAGHPVNNNHRLPSNDWRDGDGYAGFKFSPDGSALFVASLGATGSGNAGIQVFRYDEPTDNWNLTTVLGGADIRQLSVLREGPASVRLFYTSRAVAGDFASALWSVTYDLSGDVFSAPNQVLTASEGQVFWGVVAMIPEPSTAVLVSLAAMALFKIRRRRGS